MMSEEKIGVVFKFFAKPSVAAIELTDGGLKVGDKIHILGHTTDIMQTVDSMQIEHEVIQEASQGDNVGLRVDGRVRPHDVVYKVVEE
jgi:putative protease